MVWFFKKTTSKTKKELSNAVLMDSVKLLVSVEGFGTKLYTLPRAAFPNSGVTFGFGVDVGQWTKKSLEEIVEKNWNWSLDFLGENLSLLELLKPYVDLFKKLVYTSEQKQKIAELFAWERPLFAECLTKYYGLKNKDRLIPALPDTHFLSTLSYSLCVFKYFADTLYGRYVGFSEIGFPIALALCWQFGIFGAHQKYTELIFACQKGEKEKILEQLEKTKNWQFTGRWLEYSSFVRNR